MIEICTAVHDEHGTYAKYVGVMMASVLVNTRMPICFHILTDKTLCKDSRKQLRETVEKLNGKIIYYDICMNDLLVTEESLHRFSIATMYRLKLLDVLPKQINRLIYLDADILFNLDILELWETNLDGNLLAGCIDYFLPGDRKYICRKGLISSQNYINAGVLVFDLACIRKEKNLFEESRGFFRDFPQANYFDQDAINYVFQGNILILDHKWNVSTVEQRRLGLSEQSIVYHFMADSPRDNQNSAPDRLFLKYLRLTPWGTDTELLLHYERRLQKKDERLQKVLHMQKIIRNHPEKSHVFWGAGGEIHSLIMSYFQLRKEDFFVDNNPALWERMFEGSVLHSPEILHSLQMKVLIIVTIFRYSEVKNQLEEWGYQEGTNFFDGRMLVTDWQLDTCLGHRDSDWDV